ncbi:unnamed protein product [Coregonus sp. 'balchen']|nr:unnamed protein product [Coregonus sp. 'balchen']
MDAKCLVSLMVVPMVAVYGTQGQDTRVKLCGREFIRMVVTSWAILNWLNSDQFANLKTTETGRDVVRQRDDQESTESVTEDQQNHPGFPSTPPQVKGEMEPSTIPLGYTVSTRTRRDVGPAGVCCRSGCNMSELVQYC